MTLYFWDAFSTTEVCEKFVVAESQLEYEHDAAQKLTARREELIIHCHFTQYLRRQIPWRCAQSCSKFHSVVAVSKFTREWERMINYLEIVWVMSSDYGHTLWCFLFVDRGIDYGKRQCASLCGRIILRQHSHFRQWIETRVARLKSLLFTRDIDFCPYGILSSNETILPFDTRLRPQGGIAQLD